MKSAQHNDDRSAPSAKIAYRPREVAEATGLGLTTVRALLAAGTLKSVRVGKCILVTADALRDFLST